MGFFGSACVASFQNKVFGTHCDANTKNVKNPCPRGICKVDLFGAFNGLFNCQNNEPIVCFTLTNIGEDISCVMIGSHIYKARSLFLILFPLYGCALLLLLGE